MKAASALSNGAWVTLRYAATSIAGFIISLAFARLASQEVFGQYQIILATVALFSFLSLPGLNMAATKAVAAQKTNAVVEAVRKSFVWSLIGVPLLLGYGIYQLLHGQSLFGGALMISAVFFPFYYAPNTWYVFYEGRSNFRPVAVRTIISSLAVAFLLVGALYLDLNVLWLVTIFFAASTAFTLYYYGEVRRHLTADLASATAKHLDFGFGLRVTVQKSIFTLSEALPPLAVGFLLGHAAVAVFQAANLFLGAISGFIGALAAITLPTIFQLRRAAQGAVMRQTVIAGLVGSAGYYLIVQTLFGHFYGADYQASYRIALSLTALPLIMAIKTTVVNYLTAEERNGVIVMVYAFANSVALAAFVLLSSRTTMPIASSSYLYLLNVLILLPLLWYYWRSPQSQPIKGGE